MMLSLPVMPKKEISNIIHHGIFFHLCKKTFKTLVLRYFGDISLGLKAGLLNGEAVVESVFQNLFKNSLNIPPKKDCLTKSKGGYCYRSIDSSFPGPWTPRFKF